MVMGHGLNLTVKLLDSNAAIERKIKKALRTELNMRFQRFMPEIKVELGKKLESWLMFAPELKAIVFGPLKGDFGLPKGSEIGAANKIMAAVAHASTVDFRPFTKNLKGGLTIKIQPANFKNILDVIDPVITKKGEELDWIRWLLTRGDDIVVAEYHVVPGNHGRSGDAIMEQGDYFRVRPEYSGTLENNAITRALQNRQKEIASILNTIIR
tara:strand:+ start:4399 stop:5034 length:636 start_codon:yes stop_codon:yes gene_type:complete